MGKASPPRNISEPSPTGALQAAEAQEALTGDGPDPLVAHRLGLAPLVGRRFMLRLLAQFGDPRDD
jgi:hypothetical protein